MSKQTIWNRLRSYGISEVGTAALMGNFECESNNESCRLQGDNTDGRTRSKQYAADVNSGRMSADTFQWDQKGWGLYQLTYNTRKRWYYDYCMGRGYPIESEQAQCEYAFIELSKDYKSLLRKLMSDGNLKDLTEEICRDFERPQFNNYEPRVAAAQKIYNEFSGSSIDTVYTETVNDVIGDRERKYETLRKGMGKGFALCTVKAWQDMLCAWGFSTDTDGVFGPDTEAKTIAWQKYVGLEPTGEVGLICWDEVLHVPV